MSLNKHDKNWYKENYLFYKSAYMAQTRRYKELEAEFKKLKEVKNESKE